jgi:hypothetical protein
VPGGVLPERLAAICASALSFDPEERCATAHELKLEILHWLEQAAGGDGRDSARKKSSLFGRH